MMLLIFICTSVVLSVGLTVSVNKNLELLNKLEEVDEQIEESLDLLDECHQKIDLKSKVEVLSNEPLVKELLQDIVDCRSAVLLIANKLYSSVNEDENTNETN